MMNAPATTLTLSPLGGLANRMRAILAADALCRSLGIRLKIVWLKESGLNARFCDLFQPLPIGEVEELSPFSSWGYVPPRKRNFFIPRLFQSVRYDLCLFDHQLSTLQENPQKLVEVIKGKNVLIASGLCFFLVDDTLFSKYFIPQPSILEEVARRTASFDTQMVVGVHIRRTDNVQSIKHSPLDAFVKKMESFPTAHFYVATDDDQVKSFLVQKFPHRILSSPSTADRTSLLGMREAVTEMYTLARTAYFLGSYYSSFSDIIIEMNGHGETVVYKVE